MWFSPHWKILEGNEKPTQEIFFIAFISLFIGLKVATIQFIYLSALLGFYFKLNNDMIWQHHYAIDMIQPFVLILWWS